tara:strand:+ start:4311 stop:5345 length:1035 start_codon:yes stop_codon:yes gene_type:complete
MFERLFKSGVIKASLSTGLLAGLFVSTAVHAQEISVPYIKETTTTLRLAHGLPPGSAYDLGANRFAELVDMYTRGEIEVQVFPSSQLGKEQDTAKDVQLGVLDMTLVAINNASMWYKPLDVFIMPFIFRDREHANAVIGGSVGEELFENYREASGNRILSVFEWGDRAIFNSKKAINHPDDLKGIKIRVPKNAVMVDTYNAFGATATAIDWGELYNALQQGLADGLEGPPQGMLDMKFNDFLDYYSYINVYYGTAVIIINDDLLNGLSEENRAAVLRAGEEAGTYQRWLTTRSHLSGLANMQELGVNVNIVEDRQAFIDRVQPIWTEYREIIGNDVFDAVLAAE